MLYTTVNTLNEHYEKEGRNTTLTGFSIYNGSAYAGGGVYIRLSAKPTFNHVVWIHNEAQGGGGGVYIKDSDTNPTFNNCTFQENKARNSQYGGGAVCIQSSAQPTFNHVIWIRNEAQGRRGGCLLYTSPSPRD